MNGTPTSRILSDESSSSYWLELRAEQLEYVKFMLEFSVRHTGKLRALAIENAKICGRLALLYKDKAQTCRLK